MERTKARILHVDDHQDTRLMMAALLQDCGYGVLTAGSVTEGLELAKEIEFDLYILDVRLPDGTGVELCLDIRNKRRIPEAVGRWTAYLQYLEPFHFRRMLGGIYRALRGIVARPPGQ